jgi:hypothetical protein
MKNAESAGSPLPVHNLILPIIGNGSSAVYFREEHFGIECGAEFGNVPLFVAELIELPADRIVWRDCECVAKGTVREADGQIGVEHEQALSDRLHKIPRVNFAHATAPAHLLMRGPSSTERI